MDKPRTPSGRKLAAIYREVAREYESTRITSGTCDTLHGKLGRWDTDYARIFAPHGLMERGSSSFDHWSMCIDFGDQLRAAFGVNGQGEMASKKARDFRVMALCFMAAMTEAGDV